MKKNTLRVLGIGFLLSAVIVAGYETFVRGNPPLEGITVQSIFDNKASELKAQADKLAKAESERDSLSSKVAEGEQSIEDLQKKEAEQADKIQSLEQNNASLITQYVGNQADESANQDTITTAEVPRATSSPEEAEGTFTITSGESSGEIAERLQADGYIRSAADFQALIDQWQLNEYIQANDYQLNPNMSMDEILSIITNGAYFY